MNRVETDQAGIYKITCVPTGKFYIGSAACFESRWKRHKNCANIGKHHSIHFQSAWNKHGGGNFGFEVLLVCAKVDLIMYEQRAINVMKPEFNMCPTAGSRLGTKHSDKARAKISAAQTGKKQSRERVEHRVSLCRGKKRSAEAVEKTAAANRGIQRSVGVKEKLAAANRGKKHSEATKIKLSLLRIGNSYALGTVHSPETRARMSAAKIGRVVTEETRVKIGNANRGKVKSVEHRTVMSVARKGRKLSHETKARMSASKKGVRFSVERRSKMGVSSRMPVCVAGMHFASRSAAARQIGKSITTISKWVMSGVVPSGNGKISGATVGTTEGLLTSAENNGRNAL